MAQNLQKKSEETGANNGEPERLNEIYFHILARNPKMTASSAVEMIGTPGTK